MNNAPRPVLHGQSIDLCFLPMGTARAIYHSLLNPKCTADTALILADAVEDTITAWGTESIYRPALLSAVNDLRRIAPFYPGGTHA